MGMRAMLFSLALMMPTALQAQQGGNDQHQNQRELLEALDTKLGALVELGIKQNFLLQCCALGMGALWGAATWSLFLASKNEREFL